MHHEVLDETIPVVVAVPAAVTKRHDLPETVSQVFIVSGRASHLFKKIRTSLVRTIAGSRNQVVPEV